DGIETSSARAPVHNTFYPHSQPQATFFQAPKIKK
ncbi:unnamed protein product, partial [Ectocarpus sp. 8 AP-2014]